MITDALAREQATDPTTSFIVQAPAGSGKTELLTQRFLRLLASVQSPEQIIALTFTKKAANEMRQRIIGALQRATVDEHLDTPHQRLTQSFAKAALLRDKKEGWNILKQPGRLRVLTIDALCQSLVQAIPLKEKQCPFARVTENSEQLYRKAVGNFYAHAVNDPLLQKPLALLLDHLDNRQERLIQFLSELLKTREQWLGPLLSVQELSRDDLEEALRTIEVHEISRFTQSLPWNLKETICLLCRQLALIENDPQSPRFALSQWTSFETANKAIIKALGSVLFTKTNDLRKGFDHHVGLRRDNCAKIIYDELKGASVDLLSQLQNEPDFISLLLRLKNLPAPCYEKGQWEILQALLCLMPWVIACLHLVFNEQNQVDFSAILQQALFALGDEEAPTDLALYMDYTIHHLLIDEFQDTSINQFQLMEKLVQGWLPEEGKTLFIVGDPMQSIYRFRQAEVGLFLKARQFGIGKIPLQPLALSSNFRSTKTVVDWVNQQFQSIFPRFEDMETGAVCFHKAVAVLDDTPDSSIAARFYPDKEQEALAIVQSIEKELAERPNDEIAVLVRSRSQLRLLIPLLREKNIAFQGVEIEQLSNLPHLQDIWTLTKALLMPANRLYWLALLRSPWAGLSLDDLYLLANWDTKKSIFHALAHVSSLSLSEEGQQRAAFLYEVLNHALERRHQRALVDWIIETASNLFADKVLSTRQQQDLEQFFSLLEKHIFFGLPEIQTFEKALETLYSQNTSPSKLQIMTIHKSKGLEFDTVILPGLGKKSRQSDLPLIRWLKLPEKSHHALTLISPLRAAHQESCAVYDYLGELDKEKEGFELQRLLYVATTRAKKRIFLFDNQEKEPSQSFRNLLNKQPFVAASLELPAKNARDLPLLQRLPAHFYTNRPLFAEESRNPLVHFPLPDEKRHYGILAHEMLQWICSYHPASPENLPFEQISSKMKQLGLNSAVQEAWMLRLNQQIDSLFKTERGRWLCKKHEAEQNEYELLLVEEDSVRSQIIDRTFIEEGIRWIIDFKTGKEDDLSQSQHKKQLEGYAGLFQQLSPLPIRCGIYYLNSETWVEWAWQQAAILEGPDYA